MVRFCGIIVKLIGMERIRHIDFSGLNSIKSRDAVRSFLQLSEEVQGMLIDFANVDFISRTAAHELLVIQNNLSSRGIDISFINVGSQVNDMLDMVKRSIGKEKQAGFRFVKWLNFEDEKKYRDYLLQF